MPVTGANLREWFQQQCGAFYQGSAEALALLHLVLRRVE
jgi:hypothetical protein